ncbi:MMPL family transporter [Paenibacillus sp. GCM10027627]|uniref:MMPL family transporter n=1 Tax=unclassified Paenibacillus TaxID=185978 RepID=UPI003645CC68
MLQKLSLAFTGPRGRWITLALWIAATVILTMTLPSASGQEKNNAPNLPEDSPSVQAEQMIQHYFPKASGLPALLVWHREAGLSESDFIVMQELSDQLADSPLPLQRESIPLHEMPLAAIAALASEDGSTLVQPILFEEGIETELLKQNLESVKETVRSKAGSDPFEAALASSELSARVSGPAGISTDATDLFKNADFVLMLATVLLVLVLLLLIYRSPILALVPLVGVGFAYAVTSPLLGWMAREEWITIDSQAIAIMTVLLFGAGTDYCLFFISRFRQELLREKSRAAALKSAFAGSSGAIAMSGFTVVLSLFALLVAHYGAYDRFAVPFSLAILVMMIASLTLVPALMAIFGRASFFPFIPRTQEMEKELAAKKGRLPRTRREENRIGRKVGALVVRKPWTVAISCTLALSLLASSAAGIKYTYDLLSTFPENMPSREGFDAIADAFVPGQLAPATVLIRDGGTNDTIAQKLAQVPNVHTVSKPEGSGIDSAVSAYTVVFSINPYSPEAMELIPLLRGAATESLGGSGGEQTEERVWVGGQTAAQYDAKKVTERDQRVIIPLVIGLIVVLLLIYLRSIIATIYLIGTVLLSYIAALGLGWLVLHYVMGFDAIQGAIPLYAFVFLIALGEDYNIFMISSIWQKRKTMPLLQAIKEGVSETGGVITSAGLILAATFAVLATLPIQVLVQFGLITAIGVLLDTFVVRPFLVPAITAILGQRAFWPSKAAKAEPARQAEA